MFSHNSVFLLRLRVWAGITLEFEKNKSVIFVVILKLKNDLLFKIGVFLLQDVVRKNSFVQPFFQHFCLNRIRILKELKTLNRIK